jgi:hypothetical protein
MAGTDYQKEQAHENNQCKDQAVELYGKWYEAQERDIIQARGNTRHILDFHDWIDRMELAVEWKTRKTPKMPSWMTDAS